VRISELIEFLEEVATSEGDLHIVLADLDGLVEGERSKSELTPISRIALIESGGTSLVAINKHSNSEETSEGETLH
jgi:hypothetical protein